MGIIKKIIKEIMDPNFYASRMPNYYK